ncbi:MAG: hypothetical protein ACRCZ9_09350 [Fusobacteriaceae bacterium]
MLSKNIRIMIAIKKILVVTPKMINFSKTPTKAREKIIMEMLQLLFL